MINIRVCRGSLVPGDCSSSDPTLNWGPVISDALLTTNSSATERGRVKIDKEFSNRLGVEIGLSIVKFIQPGQITAIDEGFYENGLMRSINIHYSISKEGISIGTSVTIERTV